MTEHELVLGEVILGELRRVLAKKLRLPDDRIAAAEAAFSAVEIVAKPAQPSPISIRHRDDRWVLATAVAGEADVLVTGDDDLLAVAKDAALPILAPRTFWELLRKGKPS